VERQIELGFPAASVNDRADPAHISTAFPQMLYRLSHGTSRRDDIFDNNDLCAGWDNEPASQNHPVALFFRIAGASAKRPGDLVRQNDPPDSRTDNDRRFFGSKMCSQFRAELARDLRILQHLRRLKKLRAVLAAREQEMTRQKPAALLENPQYAIAGYHLIPQFRS
jgi:hypothetical protein